ncbi:hypothetical protein MJO28_005096 [Puccinia striiformis f. sp. tritici]|uniref:SigF-like NTF2-like domain-containing protein n=6 Tax=Puccinia striiformis TaxID=27350 RepID=A0A0L0UXD0_9BASI|nr:hypothetical protein Pst134EB_014591 [Puccinia striiformis f. sp. tritici]KNE91684.1 hypothetical protein PSTG_14904 [Puccinia striiformis f. sp. tritici PST-78]POW11513.1 hypothetical protein PSTT_05265 [Puccinia striiformis]KAI7951812.1 hypothetical protein MJO28_007496 [Puccinia striiformis f. sp. tritici]KAI7951818.1 hypothetical protein MJO28_007502 [Puccinia striiformis f. sp. tritici]
MDDPVAEIRDVVRSLVEPYEASVLASNVEKYFTEDAFILHPLLNQTPSKGSREHLRGIYKILRVFTINNKIEFHAVMFNEDKTQGSIELTEHLYPRLFPCESLKMSLPLWIRIDLIKDTDGKYRICRQHDMIPADPGIVALPFLSIFTHGFNIVKAFNGLAMGTIGKFLLDRKYFGA